MPKQDVRTFSPAEAEANDLFAPSPDPSQEVPNNQTFQEFLEGSAPEGLNPEVITNVGLEDDEPFEDPVPQSVAQPQVTPTPTHVEEQQETIDLPEGSVVIQRTKDGYKAVLEQADGGGQEVFKGKTKNELISNVLAGKLKATAHIRKLNKKLKVGVPTESAPVMAPSVTARELTANEVFEIKSALEANPAKAFDLAFQKQYNMSMSDLVTLARRGAEAHDELSVESVSNAFKESHPEYYPLDENGYNMMAWMVKHKLHRSLTKQDNFGNISAELLAKGLYTVENLEEAYEDLTDSGLLTPAPDAQETVPVAPVTPAPTPQEQRIVAQTRRPRAGLGIRPSSVASSQPTPVNSNPPSAEDLDKLSDKEIQALWNSVRQYAVANRRK